MLPRPRPVMKCQEWESVTAKNSPNSHRSLIYTSRYAYMNQLDKNRFQIAKHRSGLHIKTQLLLKVTAKGNLD